MFLNTNYGATRSQPRIGGGIDRLYFSRFGRLSHQTDVAVLRQLGQQPLSNKGIDPLKSQVLDLTNPSLLRQQLSLLISNL